MYLYVRYQLGGGGGKGRFPTQEKENLMAVETSPHVAPTQTVRSARGGAAFSRDFVHERGTVEVTTGITEPLVTAKASFLTTGAGTDRQFWALKTSITVFHRLSHQFITVEEAAHELPVTEKALLTLHGDEPWTTSWSPDGMTLSGQFQTVIKEASTRGLELAQLWEAIGSTKTQAESDGRWEIRSISAELQRAICQALAQS
jgi:hypothetical protein